MKVVTIEKRCLSVRELASYLGISKSFVHKQYPLWITESKIKAYRFGKKIVFEKTDIDLKLLPKLALKILLIASITTSCFNCFSAPINTEKLANAIYKAENSKRYPYGILKKFKHTSPRQACINTIKHAQRDWNGKGDFIAFLGKRYCPIGAKNDPNGLNKNWVNNVKKFYR